MYGKTEITKSNFRSEIIVKAARVIPMAKDPVLPTKILPRKLKKASISQTINGQSRRIAKDPEMVIKPIIIIAGQIVSNPFIPPSWLTLFVIIVTRIGMIMK